MNVTPVGTQRDILGECPLWDEREQALFWVDIRRPALRRLDPATGALETRLMPGLVGSVALAGPGELLLALAEQIVLYSWRADQLETVAEVPVRIPGHRFNDGRCDRQGRFWVGTMHNITRAPEGVLYRLDRSGQLVPVLEGICIPNSLAWSPDGRTMYFSDSLRYAIGQHEFDPDAGTMGAAQPFVRTAPPGFPDGSTVDAEGYLWNAEFNAGRVVRYARDGSIDRIIAVPTSRPTSCAFGGPDLRTLFITSTSQNMSEAELVRDPFAGALFAFEAGVSGIPEPRWARLAAAIAR
ncbi:MAG: SMP-30/gluconolactonase/LRE family protein [Acetobacteraceae bacterium]|nr:SMP-30/gluconolactonase/LRE family protein [Acetobacteraceae bacterium]